MHGGNSKIKQQRKRNATTMSTGAHRNTGTNNIIEKIDLDMRIHGCLPKHSLPFPA